MEEYKNQTIIATSAQTAIFLKLIFPMMKESVSALWSKNAKNFLIIKSLDKDMYYYSCDKAYI